EIYENLWLSTLEELSKTGGLKANAFIVRRMLTGALSWTVTWYRPERGGLTLGGLTDQVMAMLGFSDGNVPLRYSGTNVLKVCLVRVPCFKSIIIKFPLLSERHWPDRHGGFGNQAISV